MAQAVRFLCMGLRLHGIVHMIVFCYNIKLEVNR